MRGDTVIAGDSVVLRQYFNSHGYSFFKSFPRYFGHRSMIDRWFCQVTSLWQETMTVFIGIWLQMAHRDTVSKPEILHIIQGFEDSFHDSPDFSIIGFGEFSPSRITIHDFTNITIRQWRQ